MLVTVTDHGSGTTNFGKALNTHPCMFDLGEPFANPSGLWSKTEVEGCPFPEAIFDAETGALTKSDNLKLAQEIHMLRHKPLSIRGPGASPSGPLTWGQIFADLSEPPSLYDSLKYDLGEYFIRIRDHVCASVPEDICPPANCTITLKMFPQWLNGLTGAQNFADDPVPKCTAARNENAMLAWKKELESMRLNSKIATFTLLRDERNRQFSIFRRFSPPGTEFDCGFARDVPEFASVSHDYTDRWMEIEDCWTGAEGAAKCLRDALKLVGLSDEPMGDLGTKEMAAPSNHLYNTSTKSCVTDPEAIFKRMEADDPDGDVQIVPTRSETIRRLKP